MNRRGFLASLAGLVVGPPAAAAALRSLPNSKPLEQAYLAPALDALVQHFGRIRQRTVLIAGALTPEHEEFAKRTLLAAVAHERQLFGACWMFYQELPQPFGVERSYIEYIGQPGVPMRYVRQWIEHVDREPELLHRFDVAFWFEPIRAKIGDTITVKRPQRYGNRIVSNAEVNQYMLSTLRRELGRA